MARQFKLSEFLESKTSQQIKLDPGYDLTLEKGVDRVVIRKVGNCVILIAGASKEVGEILKQHGG
jgi:hypothetical protein